MSHLDFDLPGSVSTDIIPNQFSKVLKAYLPFFTSNSCEFAREFGARLQELKYNKE